MPNPIKGFQTKNGVRKYDYNELENLPETNPDDLALEVEEVKENIEAKKANIDGSYSSMTVGNAEQLVGTVGEEDSTPYNFRTSGGSIEIGDRETDKVVGGTLAWNQLVKNGNFVDNSGWGSFISCANNIATFTGGQQGTYNTTVARTYNNFVPNHKLLIIADVRCSSSTRCRTRYPFVGNKGTSLPADTWVQFYDIGTSLANMNQIGIQFDGITDATYNVKNFVCFDLTQMFSSTIADYIHSLEQANAGDGVVFFKKLFPKDYYEYNEGELMSVKTSAHKMVGFNAWDGVYEDGYIDPQTGENIPGMTQNKRSSYIEVVPNMTYYFRRVTSSINNGIHCFYDADKNFISSAIHTRNSTFVIPSDAQYMRFAFVNCPTIYPDDICINLSWDGERDGEYEEYEEHVYPLDSSLELRGIPKLDSANNLYYDGDTYESDGTVTRKYVTKTITSDDVTSVGTASTGVNYASLTFSNYGGLDNGNAICDKYQVVTGSAPQTSGFFRVTGGGMYFYDNAFTDLATAKQILNGITVVYEHVTPTTETAEPYQNPQIVNDFGTEEYVDERAVPIPVGHQTKYLANLRAKLEMAPDSPSADGEYIVKQTNGKNEYIALGSSTTMQSIMAKLPSPPSEDGAYTLKVTVANGTATYSWGE